MNFAQVWRSRSKWVASRSLTPVGPNATVVQGDLIDFSANLKSERDGEIDVAGAELANALSAADLVDEYRLYFRPYVLGTGNPTLPCPCPLSLVKHDAIGEDAVRLTLRARLINLPFRLIQIVGQCRAIQAVEPSTVDFSGRGTHPASVLGPAEWISNDKCYVAKADLQLLRRAG
jgi:hypothetical protein